jgi:hypothetical protein
VPDESSHSQAARTNPSSRADLDAVPLSPFGSPRIDARKLIDSKKLQLETGIPVKPFPVGFSLMCKMEID